MFRYGINVGIYIPTILLIYTTTFIENYLCNWNLCLLYLSLFDSNCGCDFCAQNNCMNWKSE